MKTRTIIILLAAFGVISLGAIGFFISRLPVDTLATASVGEVPQRTSHEDDSIARRELISKSFSAWDGSHNNLEQYVKDHMNDPESFKHVETKFWDFGTDTIIIKMTYRGKNAFGGVVTARVRAEANVDGTLLDVKSDE